MSMLFDDLPEVLEKVLKPMVRDNKNRGYSWNHCYSFFQKNHKKIDNSNIKKLACLYLGFYLASWGMYRGRSGLLQKDYTIYRNIVNTLLKDKFNDLWRPNYYQRLLTGSNKIEHESIKIVFDLYEELGKSISDLQPYSKFEKKKGAKYDKISATNTLITKIILGTMTCVPAYDRYLKMGLQKRRCSQSFSKKFPDVLEKCRKYNLMQKLEKGLQRENIKIRKQGSKIKIKIKVEEKAKSFSFPIMKIVDLYFWGIGAKKK